MSLGKAQKLLEAGRFEDAEAALHYGAGKDPRLKIVLSRVRTAEGKPEDALAVLREGITEHPDHAPTRVFEGITLLDAGKPIEAEKAFRRVLEIQPGNLVAQSYLGLTLMQLGRDEEALAEFRKNGLNDSTPFLVRLTEWMELQWLETGRFFGPVSVETPPAGDKKIRNAEHKARNAFFSHKYMEVIRLLAPQAQGEKANPDFAFACGVSCEQLSDWPQALMWLDRVGEDKDIPDAYRAARARSMLRMRKFDEAAELLASVLMIGPEDYGVNYYLGVLCLAHGEKERARQLFFRAYSDYLVDTVEYQFWQIQRALLLN